MEKLLLFIVIGLNFQLSIVNCQLLAPPTIQWAKCFGGSFWDYAYSIQQTSDSGYIVAGFSNSNDSEVYGNHGGYDYWIVKLNSLVNIEWQKCLGGSKDDYASSILQTNDGGYIFTGSTYSNDSDVSGFHDGLWTDYWIVKLNSIGNIEWQKCLGGGGFDIATSILQTIDRGYIIAGSSFSNDGNVSGNHGGFDYWIVKLDSIGKILWQKSLGGSMADEASSIQLTRDGGFIIAGYTNSIDGDVKGRYDIEQEDYWVVKIDSIGNILWQKCLGGSDEEEANYILQTNDGGYIVAGWTISNDRDVNGNHGGYDYWIVKLDTIGKIQWQKCLGGSTYDIANIIQQTSDGGYIVAGSSNSNDGDAIGNLGDIDYWVVKLDTYGDIQWQKCLGDSNWDEAYSIQQTKDLGYIIVGYTYSNHGDVKGNHGKSDFWIVKLSPDTTTKAVEEFASSNKSDFSFKIEPNPATDYISISFSKGASSLVGNHSISIYNSLGIEMITAKVSDTFEV